MDRNQLIGLLLILVLFVGYQYLMPKPPPTPPTTQQAKTTKPVSGSTAASATALAGNQPVDSVAAKAQFGAFAAAATGQERDVVVENPEVKITFSTLGGQVKEVLLKKFKAYNGKPLVLIDARTSQSALEMPTRTGKVDVHKLYFQTTGPTAAGQPITFRADLGNGQAIEQVYTVPAAGYVVDYQLKTAGLDNVLGTGDVRLLWMDQMQQYENDLSNNRRARHRQLPHRRR